MKVSVVVPTRRQIDPVTGTLYLDRALASVGAQRTDVEVVAVVGVDRSPVPLGQARPYNEAVARADGDLLAFLEDDDTWAPLKLATQLPFLERFDLVTCNQREVDERGAFLRYSYYPTPSGWLMRRSTWDRVGGLDEALRFHADTDWLGRASRLGLRRVHLVQAGADPDVDRWVVNMVPSSVVSAMSAEPLVNRTVRAQSMSGRIQNDVACRTLSEADLRVIRARFGRVPW
jgi:glycosyltransferase involved in cell wall biosynthesis